MGKRYVVRELTSSGKTFRHVVTDTEKDLAYMVEFTPATGVEGYTHYLEQTKITSIKQNKKLLVGSERFREIQRVVLESALEKWGSRGRGYSTPC